MSASTAGPGNDIYTVYVIGDFSPSSHCTLYFLRWDGRNQELIYTYYESNPCQATPWTELRFNFQESQALGLKGYWSDINHNGLPEFAIYQSNGCLNDCNDANGGRLKVLEIQSTDRVVDIVADLPGSIDQTSERLLHSADPLAIYVHQYDFYQLHDYTDVDLIYAWEDDQYVNVSEHYTDDYRQQIQDIGQSVRQQYGHPLYAEGNGHSAVSQMLNVLAMTNNLRLPAKEAVDLFLDLAKPTHWPGSGRPMNCWLQLMRAYVQIDYASNVAFRILPPDSLQLDFPGMPASWAARTQEFRAGIDEKRFDVSACK